jgi:hypothetical protein
MRKYLCGVDFQHELEEGRADLYDTVAKVKRNKPCWKECGIVEINFKEDDDPEFYTNFKWLVKQDLKLGKR